MWDALVEGEAEATRCLRPADARPASASRPIVLLLTKESDEPNGLALLVAAAGYDVRRRAPDEAGLAVALEEPVAAVLADAPAGDPALLRWIRRLARERASSAPPVVVVAADPSEDEIQQAFGAGARDVLGKPVLPSLLRVKLRQYARAASDRRRYIGPYAIQRVLGRGGWATVYLAERAGSQVALKVIDAGAVELQPEVLARFRRETAALRLITDPGTPRFIDAGRAQDAFYCAMEYVPGPTLSDLLHEAPLPDARVEAIVLELARTLSAVHATGLVHRDVKPANVVVPLGRPVCLVDFGLAKDLADFGVTRADEIVGTAAYMAPERALGTPADGRADAYALGISGIEAALGGPAVEGSPFKVLSELARGRVPRAGRLLRGRCPVLISVLDGLVKADPAHRLELEEVVRRLSGCCTPVALRASESSPRAA